LPHVTVERRQYIYCRKFSETVSADSIRPRSFIPGEKKRE